MSEEKKAGTPASPETQPEEVRSELNQNFISHQGQKLKPSQGSTDSESYMGATEENVTPVQAPVDGPSEVTDPDSGEDLIDPRSELTPG